MIPLSDQLKKTCDNDHCVVYGYSNDYVKFSVFFDKDLKTYDVDYAVWINNDRGDFVPMEERPEAIKHASVYGLFQRSDVHMTINMHNFITKVMRELGWAYLAY